jgi:hypothetical protein
MRYLRYFESKGVEINLDLPYGEIESDLRNDVNRILRKIGADFTISGFKSVWGSGSELYLGPEEKKKYSHLKNLESEHDTINEYLIDIEDIIDIEGLKIYQKIDMSDFKTPLYKIYISSKDSKLISFSLDTLNSITSYILKFLESLQYKNIKFDIPSLNLIRITFES